MSRWGFASYFLGVTREESRRRFLIGLAIFLAGSWGCLAYCRFDADHHRRASFISGAMLATIVAQSLSFLALRRARGRPRRGTWPG